MQQNCLSQTFSIYQKFKNKIKEEAKTRVAYVLWSSKRSNQISSNFEDKAEGSKIEENAASSTHWSTYFYSSTNPV